MIFEVTQADIDAGNTCRETDDQPACKICPVAQCMQRTTGEFWAVYGDEAYRFDTWFSGNGVQYELPNDVYQRIDRYDQQGAMEPFSFELELREV